MKDILILAADKDAELTLKALMNRVPKSESVHKFRFLETWLWVNKTHFHRILDWEHSEDIYQWIEAKGLPLSASNLKPVRPKEAFESVLKFQKIPRSSSLYSELAQHAGYKDCIDPSFKKFIHTIQNWLS